MAQVQLVVGGRHYRVACQDGGEAHLEAIADLLDGKIAQVARTMGGMDEARALLFGALLLADELAELRGKAAAPAPSPIAPQMAEAMERLAMRVEALAGRLEQPPANA